LRDRVPEGLWMDVTVSVAVTLTFFAQPVAMNARAARKKSALEVFITHKNTKIIG
jgi:hypothetical protein